MNLIETVKDYWWMLKNYTPSEVRSLLRFRDDFQNADKAYYAEEVRLSADTPEKTVMIVANVVHINEPVSCQNLHLYS